MKRCSECLQKETHFENQRQSPRNLCDFTESTSRKYNDSLRSKDSSRVSLPDPFSHVRLFPIFRPQTDAIAFTSDRHDTTVDVRSVIRVLITDQRQELKEKIRHEECRLSSLRWTSSIYPIPPLVELCSDWSTIDHRLDCTHLPTSVAKHTFVSSVNDFSPELTICVLNRR